MRKSSLLGAATALVLSAFSGATVPATHNTRRVRNFSGGNMGLSKQAQIDLMDAAEIKRARKRARPNGHYAG